MGNDLYVEVQFVAHKVHAESGEEFLGTVNGTPACAIDCEECVGGDLPGCTGLNASMEFYRKRLPAQSEMPGEVVVRTVSARLRFGHAALECRCGESVDSRVCHDDVEMFLARVRQFSNEEPRWFSFVLDGKGRAKVS